MLDFIIIIVIIIMMTIFVVIKTQTCFYSCYTDMLSSTGYIKMKNIILTPEVNIIQNMRQIGKQMKYNNICSLV